MQQKSYKVFWTEKALNDLESIKIYIAQDSEARARSWIKQLFNYGEDLCLMPNRGRIVPELNQQNLRELLIENYRMVYRIGKERIEIITVFERHHQPPFKK